MAKKTLIYEAMDDMFIGGKFLPRGTTVVQGHELLKGRTKLFRPFVPTYGEVEEEESKAESKTDDAPGGTA